MVQKSSNTNETIFPMKRQSLQEQDFFLFVCNNKNKPKSWHICSIFIPKGKNRNFHCTLKLLPQIFTSFALWNQFQTQETYRLSLGNTQLGWCLWNTQGSCNWSVFPRGLLQLQDCQLSIYCETWKDWLTPLRYSCSPFNNEKLFHPILKPLSQMVYHFTHA